MKGEGVGSEKIDATPRTIAMAEGSVIMRTDPSMRKDRYEELKGILEGRRLDEERPTTRRIISRQ